MTADKQEGWFLLICGAIAPLTLCLIGFVWGKLMDWGFVAPPKRYKNGIEIEDEK